MKISMFRIWLACLISCILLVITGCTQTSGTLGGAAIGTGAGAGIGYSIGGKGGAIIGGAIGGLAGGALGNEVGAEREQAESTKTSNVASRDQTVVHTYDNSLEAERQRIEIERQRVELEKEKLELEKTRRDLFRY
ncbi:MAG: hypothetical protein LBB16_03990 [Puniceicoccales bacterium]|jgi:uncharacterized protein YcfJ|nr:hypothetical protein [Puniceicoccales bacterium]